MWWNAYLRDNNNNKNVWQGRCICETKKKKKKHQKILKLKEMSDEAAAAAAAKAAAYAKKNKYRKDKREWFFLQTKRKKFNLIFSK